MTKDTIDPKVYDLYDEYCHTQMTRRDFLNKASALAVVGGAGLAMAQALLPQYAEAQTISFTDERIKARHRQALQDTRAFCLMYRPESHTQHNGP